MAAEVFTRPEVGKKYNQGFVNVKIDAEKGEGIALAKKYQVKSYPTYLFINPADESLIDMSKSSMAAADFNDVGDKMLFKFTGKEQISLADLVDEEGTEPEVEVVESDEDTLSLSDIADQENSEADDVEEEI